MGLVLNFRGFQSLLPGTISST